jgi:hypothetical protein
MSWGMARKGSTRISGRSQIKGELCYIGRALEEEYVSLKNADGFSRLRTLCAYIDWCNELLPQRKKSEKEKKQKGSTKPTRRLLKDTRFIKRYLQSVNPTYCEIAGILRVTFRHPSVHRGRPDVVLLSGPKVVRLGWVIQPGDRETHLKVTKDVTERKGCESWVLNVHPDQLYDDVQRAIKLFGQDVLARSKSTVARYARRIRELEEPQTEDVLLKRYGKNPLKREFDFIKTQVVR